jgi:hypothetical protein
VVKHLPQTTSGTEAPERPNFESSGPSEAADAKTVMAARLVGRRPRLARLTPRTRPRSPQPRATCQPCRPRRPVGPPGPGDRPLHERRPGADPAVRAEAERFEADLTLSPADAYPGMGRRRRAWTSGGT